MSLVEQVIFVADYIEPGRDFPGVEKAREIAAESLSEAVKYEIRETLKHLIEKQQRVYPRAIESYNAWVAE